MTNIIRILLQDCSPSIHSYFKTSFSFNNTPWILTWIIQSCHFLIPYCNRKIPGTSAGHSRPSINGPHSTPKASPLCRPRLSSPTYCIASPEQVPHVPASRCSLFRSLTLAPTTPFNTQLRCTSQGRLFFPNNLFCPCTLLPLSSQLSTLTSECH